MFWQRCWQANGVVRGVYDIWMPQDWVRYACLCMFRLGFIDFHGRVPGRLCRGIHGKLHPMIAVLSIGDCELLMLRRTNGRQSEAWLHRRLVY